MDQTLAESERKPEGSVGRLVVRNTLYLTVSQALTIPLSILTNAAMARFLGAEDFGWIYLASTLVGFGFVAVDWGHSSALPAQVARDRSRSGAVLGTSLVWRLVVSVIVYGVLALGCHLFGYGSGLQWALGLTSLCYLLNMIVAAYKDTIRGFERTDIPAFIHVAQQLLGAVFVVVVLVLGGRMRAALLALAAAGVIMLVPIWRSVGSVGVGKRYFEWSAFRSLFAEGTPFVLFGVAMVLVPNIDAVYLSKLAPPDVMGWYAASRRLIGMLLLPATALIGALYPTLCRLWATDKAGFNKATSGSLQATGLLVVPVALGCALYPDLGVAIFSRKTFGPAELNLQISAAFLGFVYFSMPIGTALLAAGRQRIWSLVQALCVVLSLVFDPIFIPWFQKRIGNGGAGVCVTSTVSELVVVIAGIALMPKGVFNRQLVRSIALALVSGGAMAMVALFTRPLVGPFVSAPLAVLTYGVGLWLTRAIGPEQMAMIQGLVGGKLSRLRRGNKSE